jgi:hypothetical protein
LTGVVGGDAVEDACGECDSNSSNDNACFTYPEEIIGSWGGEEAHSNNPDCSGDPIEVIPSKNQITFKDDGTLSHRHRDRLNGQYPCDQNPGCNINVDGEELVGTCSEDGFCQIQVTERGAWSVNNNELCLLMGENEDPAGSKEYVCGEYIFSDDEKSFTLTLILNTTECFILNFNQLKYTISINGTTEIFDHTSFIVDWQAEGLIIETYYIEVVNDTVFQVAYQEPNYSPVETNTIITPLFPSVGSAWQGMFGGPANIEVQKLTNIVVPADTALAYIYQIHEEDSEEYQGSMTFSEDIGMLSMMGISGDTFSIVLETYTIVGGNGVIPLAIGNEWTYVDGNYDDIQPCICISS